MQHGPYLIPAGAPPGTPLLLEEERPPEAVYYFRIYAALIILNLLGVFGGGLFMMLKPLMSGASGGAATEDLIVGLVLVGSGFLPMVPHGLALFGGRRKWVYTLALVLIGINMLWVSCCLPITIPMLIYWMKPETKRWYGA